MRSNVSRKLQATLKDGRRIEYLHSDDPPSGTMKEVYFTPDGKEVVCLYKDPTAGLDPVRIQRLEAILGKNNPTLPRSQGGAAQNDADAAYYRNLFCWPTAIVTQPRFGIVTPVYPKNFFFSDGPLKGKEKNGSWFILAKPRKLLERTAPQELGNWRNYLALCIQMARAVSRLHQAGLAHSDLSNNNVLVDPVGGASVVIDIDSLVVPGLYPPDVLGTKGYIAPEVLATIQLPVKDPKRKLPSARTDEHALAVLCYEYLLRRHPLEGRRIPAANTAEEQDFLTFGPQALYCEHPTDFTNRPVSQDYVPASRLGLQISDLFRRAFVDGLKNETSRPTASEWVKGLVHLWDTIVPCENLNCPAKWFPVNDPKQLSCCFCKAKPNKPIPILKFRSEARAGQWMPDGSVVLHHNWSMFEWHAFANKFPGPASNRAPLAYCVWHGGQWLLVNQSLSSLTSPSGNRVPAGQAVALTAGTRFRLSQDTGGRLAEVEVVKP